MELEHERVAEPDPAGPEGARRQVDLIRRRIRVRGALSAEQRRRLLEIADRCPVSRTLKAGPRILDELEEEGT